MQFFHSQTPDLILPYLHISMNEAARMHMLKRLSQLRDNEAKDVLGKAAGDLQHLGKVTASNVLHRRDERLPGGETREILDEERMIDHRRDQFVHASVLHFGEQGARDEFDRANNSAQVSFVDAAETARAEEAVDAEVFEFRRSIRIRVLVQ